MRRPANGRAAFWVGSIALHLVFIAVLAVAALRWRTDPPPQELAVEGNVVRYEDLPASVRAGRPLRESPPPPVRPVVEQPPPVPEPQRVPEPQPAPPESLPPQPAAEPVDDTARKQAVAEAQRLEQERIALERRQAEDERLAEVKRTQEAQAQELKAAEDKRRAVEAAEAQRQAEQRKQQEALAARQQQQAEREQADREARQRAEREAELRRALESEEEGEAFARSGVVDEYRALLVQTIERNWIKPPSARAGLKCMLYVTQASGGTVLDVRIGECNGDQAVRESVANAVYRSSPLPAPRDPRAFQRQLVMNFEPKE
jgi:colicin import membrane protein